MNYIRVTGWTKKIELLLNLNAENIDRIYSNRKNLQSKGLEITQLKFSSKFFVNESLSYENQQLAYKCRKLKSARKIYSTWFYNNCVNIKLSEHSNPVKKFYIRDIENLMGTDNLEEFLRSS